VISLGRIAAKCGRRWLLSAHLKYSTVRVSTSTLRRAGRKRMWTKLDDGFADHPKVAFLSDAAFRSFVSGLCFANRYLTDGVILSHAVAKISTAKVRKELVAVGLWKDREDGGVSIHDFLEYNRDAETVKAERRANAERQKRWREHHRNGVTDGVSNGRSNGVSNGTQSRPVPDPSCENRSTARDDATAEETPNIGDPVIRLVIALKDADDKTENVIRALVIRHGLSEGDLMWAKECATGPGVRSPAAVAVAELKKRAKTKEKAA
jgi:hypothetical protein